jgi:hypothetical protein
VEREHRKLFHQKLLKRQPSNIMKMVIHSIIVGVRMNKMSCKKLHHYLVYPLACNLLIPMYQWILVKMDERKLNQYPWHGREKFMASKHCISSCKRPNLTQAEKHGNKFVSVIPKVPYHQLIMGTFATRFKLAIQMKEMTTFLVLCC